MAIRRFATNIIDGTDFDSFNGNAIPGELVVNLSEDPPRLYISDNSGNLTAVATLSSNSISNINSSKVTLEPKPSREQLPGVITNNNGSIKSSWLLTLDEGNSMIISQAQSFNFTGDVVNLNADTVQLPDGGLLSPHWNIFQAQLGTVVQGITFSPMTEPLPATSLMGDYSIPVQINGTNYYIHLSSTA